ncbi:hypothetical protein [Vibrio mangrovi]|uniref:Uncharacterized protein n=1 Tax=Vibrio mangrovi TaxID=474394 RepID=A0A1Y6IWL3_9VIBR|nr:hypothetical protein [Vibrio mangrovi]MDW6005509.1 hypothetical protein [Vibrio mangrovi]SMS02049.1 hypothetical protein VIM7927_03363 [Vibrio mangrovi]
MNIRYFVTDDGFVRSEKALKINRIDYSELTELTEQQIEEFVINEPPEGKQRDGLSWVDIPVVVTAASEYQWVQAELDDVDVQLKYHATGDTKRQQLAVADWNTYAIALRDYTTTDTEGNVVIVGDARPVRPTDGS